MRKQFQIGLAVLFLVLAAGITWQVVRLREPGYKGIPLSLWLLQYGTNHFPVVQAGPLGPQAQTALRQIGTNAIPIYLRIITTRESPSKLWLMARVPNRWSARLHVRSAFDYRLLGAFGLIALGPDSRSAIPTLIASVNDSNPDIRYAVGFTLEALAPVAGNDLLPFLKKCVEDPDVIVQSEAIRVLGQMRQESEQVIPLLLAILAKPSGQQGSMRIRADTLRALRQFGVDAKPAVPSLVELLNDADVDIRSAATNALRKIDPDAAVKAGVK